jgi:hypothetical protein
MNAHKIDSQTATVHATPAAGVFANAENRAGIITAGNHGQVGGWNRLTDTRPSYPYTLFNKSPLQLRRIGALGGKAHGRNQRARRALMPTVPAATPLRSAPQQSTAEAVAVLDAQFPWLSGAEHRHFRNPSSRWLPAHSPHCVKRSE